VHVPLWRDQAFQEEQMLPYAASDDAFIKGYAERNEYEPVQKS
jgi:hypothetical protein